MDRDFGWLTSLCVLGIRLSACLVHLLRPLSWFLRSLRHLRCLDLLGAIPREGHQQDLRHPQTLQLLVRPELRLRPPSLVAFSAFWILLLLWGRGISDGRSRIQRAWTAGNWAKAVLQGRAGSPNRTPQLSLQPRVYVLLRADGLSRPACFRSSRSYWSALGGAHVSSISHSFPSETEARVYCEAAGFDPPEIQQ